MDYKAIIEAEKRAILKEQAGNITALRKKTVLDEKRQKLWKTILIASASVLGITALRFLSFRSLVKAQYRDFIKFIDKYRTTMGPNGAPLYTGKSGITTAMALESGLFSVFFNNRLLPEALFIAVTTDPFRGLFKEEGGENFLEEIYKVSIEGTPDNKELNSITMVCRAATLVFGSKFTECPVSSCHPSTSKSFGMKLAHSVIESSTNAAFAGQGISAAMAGGHGVAGAGIGLLVGAGIGVAASFIQKEEHETECAEKRKYCALGVHTTPC